MWLALGFTLAGAFVVLYLLARRDEQRVRREWEPLLGPDDDAVYRGIERQVLADMALAERMLDEALALRAAGSVALAERRLDAGYAVLEQVSSDLLTLLAATATLSRSFGPMAPVPPLEPDRFRLDSLARLARWHQMLHRLMPTASLRCRLRAYFLARGVGLMTRRLPHRVRSTDRALRKGLQTPFGDHPEHLLWQWAERREQWRQGPPAPVNHWALLFLFVALLACEWLRQSYGA